MRKIQRYMPAVLALGATFEKKPGVVRHIEVQHDDWCERLKDPPGDCNCEPVVKERP